ncbi:Hypothetical protein HDN1F_19370 [gamma proteobacterium HdN1]|nr:Hypothetical protein HDN1F_19370 [gamma proteobacterium HdN1]
MAFAGNLGDTSSSIGTIAYIIACFSEASLQLKQFNSFKISQFSCCFIEFYRKKIAVNQPKFRTKHLAANSKRTFF